MLAKRIIVKLAIPAIIVAGLGAIAVGSKTQSGLPKTVLAPPSQINSDESIFADVIVPSKSRLETAAEAKTKGDYARAKQDYMESLEQEPASAEVVFPGLVDVFKEEASKARSEDRYVDESRLLNECYRILQGIVHQDESSHKLSDEARDRLFDALNLIDSLCTEAAKSHLDVADRLALDGVSAHWWIWNDQDKFMQAVHEVDIAWSYYPAHLDERMTERMYKVHSDMKSDLSSWRYNRVTECDRLQIGRAFGDK